MKTKEEFIKKLGQLLKNSEFTNEKDILADVSEYFDAKSEKGKSEEEIIAELGSPDDVLKQYVGENKAEIIKARSENKTALIFGFILGVVLATFSILVSTGVINFIPLQLIQSVYVDNSKTVFENDNISVTLVNTKNEEFVDVIVHISHIDKDKNFIGPSYSEQKIVKLGKKSTVELTFKNPGWYPPTEHTKIVACYYQSGGWLVIHDESEFKKLDFNFDPNMIYVTIAGLGAICLFVGVGIVLIRDRKNRPKLKETKSAE